MNTVEPTYEPEPVEAVECSYTTAVYKIKYINISADEDGELNQQKIIRLFEVVDKPHGTCQCTEEEWSSDDEYHNVIPDLACCSKGFIENIEKKIKLNHTSFPTMLYFGASRVWIILEVTKIN